MRKKGRYWIVDEWIIRRNRFNETLQTKTATLTGYSLSEALNLTSMNQKYVDRLLVELQVQYMFCTSNCFVFVMTFRTI